jgi:hypothetical protein
MPLHIRDAKDVAFSATRTLEGATITNVRIEKDEFDA